jgi:malate permease and related proteins
LLGLGSGLLHLHPPGMLQTAMSLAGNAAIPLMLLSLGTRLVDVNLRAWRIGVMGAIVCPLAGLVGAVIALQLLPFDPTSRAQLFLFAVLPPAVLNYMLAEAYDQEPDQVASITLLGNLAALVFVPLGLVLAGHPG